MSKRDTNELLTDILESISKIFRYTEHLDFDSFCEDEKTIDAVARNFEIIGEAANKIERAEKDKFPDVEWKRIIALRHRIIHEYFGIDINILWQIKEKHLATFYSQIENMQKELQK